MTMQRSHLARLYSEIDHIHLSSEAQCVSHLYPRWTATYYMGKVLGLREFTTRIQNATVSKVYICNLYHVYMFFKLMHGKFDCRLNRVFQRPPAGHYK